MKIVVNARFLTQPISGVQRYGIECSRQIKKLYPATTFVSHPGIVSIDVADELEVKIIGKNKSHVWEQIDLPLYLKKIGSPPLLNFANTAPLLYTNNYITLHDLAFLIHPEWNSKLFAAWYNFLIPRILKRSKHIFTVSETIKTEIIEAFKIPGHKISVTYNGVSELLAKHRNNEGGTKIKEKIILSVGTFNTRKNHQNLIKGFLKSEIKNDYKLVLIGDKNRVFSETGIDENDIDGKQIVILQHLSETELVEMYQKAEAVVSLSKYEGFGIPILEGLYSGCKGLCSDIPVYRELYHDLALFCDPMDIDKISAALLQITDKDNTHGDAQLTELLGYCNYAKSAQTIVEIVMKSC